jgi:hypothetical protein
LLRWREDAFRQQHAEENLYFCPSKPEHLTHEEDRSVAMEILYTNCAGLDVHKKTVKACLLTQGTDGQAHKEFRTYLTTTEELLKLSDWLKEQGCTHIARRGQRVCIGNQCSTCWKAVLNCWWSMLSISRRSPDARRISRMPSGLLICCDMACGIRQLHSFCPTTGVAGPDALSRSINRGEGQRGQSRSKNLGRYESKIG